MLSSIKNKLRNAVRWKKIVWDEKAEYKVPLFTRIIYAFRGFSRNEYVWYKLNENDWREYISEFERVKSREINGNYKFILDDKIVFEEVFGKYAMVPKNLAWINNGIIYPLHESNIHNSNIIEYLKNGSKCVLKWNSRGGGFGTYVIGHNDEGITLNDKAVSDDTVIQLFSRNGSAILCEYIEQSEFSSSLYPYSTNTIRMVCAKKKGEERARMIIATQRIGCDASRPVDNVSSGGLTAEIDIDTGEMCEAYAKSGDMKNRMIPWESHPDTGAKIKGKVIPKWEELKSQIEDLTNQVPYINFVAWDILLTNDGFCIIEGNASSCCRIFQMKEGRKNGPLGDIYRSYGIIK